MRYRFSTILSAAVIFIGLECVATLRAETIEELEQRMTDKYDDARYPEAAGMATRLLNRVQREMPGDRTAIATCHAYMGRALTTMSRSAEAEHHFKEALRIGTGAPDVVRKDLAQVMQDLGSLYIFMGKYSEALTQLSAATKIYKDEGGDSTEAQADLRLRFAVLLQETGRFADAEKQAIEAREAARKLPDWTELQDTIIDLMLGDILIRQSGSMKPPLMSSAATTFVSNIYARIILICSKPRMSWHISTPLSKRTCKPNNS